MNVIDLTKDTIEWIKTVEDCGNTEKNINSDMVGDISNGFRESLLEHLGYTSKNLDKWLKKSKINKKILKKIRDFIKKWVDDFEDIKRVKKELTGYHDELDEYVSSLRERSMNNMSFDHDLDILRNRINKTIDDIVGCGKVFREMLKERELKNRKKKSRRKQFIMGGGRENNCEYECMEEDIPKEFICSISLDVMKDPVIASDGHTYERTSLERLFEFDTPKSPITREYLDKWMIVPNYNLKKLINDYV